MKTICIQIIALLLPAFAFAQTLSPQVQRQVARIAEENYVAFESVGPAGEVTDQYRSFTTLKNKATTAELLLLLKHENAVVRAYAGWALADRKYLHAETILLRFLKSNEWVQAQDGCIGGSEDLASLFYRRVFHQVATRSKNRPLGAVINAMDSVILYEADSSSTLLETALEHSAGNSQHYNRIRMLALHYKTGASIVALARYKKADDVNFLMTLNTKAFPAIAVFPHPEFWPFLQRYQSTEKTFAYFNALAGFRNEESVALLTKMFDQPDSEKAATIASQLFNELDHPRGSPLEQLYEAITVNAYPGYEPLQISIWRKYQYIDNELINTLIKRNPDSAAVIFADGLLQPGDIKKSRKEMDNYANGSKFPVVAVMLKVIKHYDPRLATDVCRYRLRLPDVHAIGVILRFVKENNLVTLAPVMMERLTAEQYAYQIFQLSQVLLHFKDKALNRQVADVLRAKRSVWEQGNRKKSFNNLLKENDIIL